jgi:predicted amidohydrolase
VRIAVGQAEAATRLTTNVRIAAELAIEAGNGGADLLLLSELFLCGYDLDRIALDPIEASVTPSDDRLQPLIDASRTSGIVVLVGAAVRAASARPGGPRMENGLLSFQPDGTVSCVYSKMHLWDRERALFVAGTRPVMLEVAGVLFGLGICYDAGFPEMSRQYARAGAHALLFSSAFAEGEEHDRYDIYHRARALESGAPTMVSNALNAASSPTFFGGSVTINAYGHLLADAGAVSGLLYSDIAPAESATARLHLQYLRDTRADYATESVHIQHLT